MAMKKHRKLFPAALTSTNQTVDCPDFCDPACPYNCYPYTGYNFIPPPPPPILGPVDPAVKNIHISPYVIIIVSLLAGFFLLVSYYVIIAKSFSGWCSPRDNNPQQSESDNAEEEFLNENRIDHPIWFITTAGLQQSIINSITVCKYKSGEGLIEGTECSVCLTEFQEDETLRLLPKCNHAFHISCIDTWLRSHTNCPLCRAQIVSGAATAPLASIELNSDDVSPTPDTQMENSRINGETGENQERNSEQCENRTEAEREIEILQVVGDERNLKGAIDSDKNGLFQVLRDSITIDCGHQFMDNEIQPIRRSVSMDSSIASSICLGLSKFCPVESEGSSVDHEDDAEKSNSGIFEKRDCGYSSKFRLAGNSSITQCLHKGPVSMKRSFSCGGRFLSTRHNRRLNAILFL